MTTRPTDEEIRAMAAEIRATWTKTDPILRAKRCNRAGEMLESWLAERQAARDRVTDEMVEHAWKVLDDALNGKIDGQEYAYGDPYPMRVALQSIAQPVKVPDGWKLVPIKPNLAMAIAAENYVGRHAWAKMIEVAPAYNGKKEG